MLEQELISYSLDIFKIFITFFIIMDPFVSGIYFLSVSKDWSDEEKKKAVNQSTFIAGATLFGFLLVGQAILWMLGISLYSFKIAGGIILLLIAIRAFMGSFLMGEKKEITDKQASILIIGVPLITGPGVLTTAIIMSGKYGLFFAFIGAIIALALTWVCLKFAEKLSKRIGETGMNITSRIMNLFLAAIAVEFITHGILAVI